MADRLDVLLGILLDKAAQQEVERGLSSVEKKIEDVGKAAGGVGNNQNLEKQIKAQSELLGMSEDFVSRNQHQLEVLAQLGGVSVEALRGAGRAVTETSEDIQEASKDVEELVNQAKGIKEEFSVASTEASRLRQVSSGLAQISGVFAVAGAALVGGIALSARQYVKFVEDAGIQGDETADRWVAASKRVQNAQLNLGEASAQVLLPVYEKAAELATKAAAFVDKNPDLVQAALNTGLVVATLAAVGTAVSRGIKIYADFKYLAANALFGSKVDKFAVSVAAFNTGSAVAAGGKGAVAGGALAGAGRVAAIAALSVGTLVLATTATNAVLDAVGAPRLQEMLDAQLNFWKNLGSVLSGDINLNELAAESIRLAEDSRDARNGVGELASGIRDFQAEATQVQATNAFVQYRQQEAQAEEQYMAQRAQIVEQGAQQIAQIEANYAEQRQRLIEGFAASSAQALANFQFQQQQAAEQFALSEANAVQEFNERQQEEQDDFRRKEERAREDHLREMRKLEEDHQDRVRDLVAARDALGLVRENRDFDRKKREAEEEYRIDKQRRRQDFQRKQRDQEEEFQQERDRRRQEFEFRQQQAAEQFAYQQAQAKAQFEARLEQLEEEHQAELAQSRRQTAERLRDLQVQYRQEQITRRNAFLDILRDLDANLLNERNLRVAYYDQMQQDLQNFLQSTPIGSNLPGYPETQAAGGYGPGVTGAGETQAAGGYGPGVTGAGEFVLTRSTTRNIEGMIGGRLTQRGIQSLAKDGGAVTVNLTFPGGFVTKKQMIDTLDKNTRELLADLTRGL